MTLLFSKILHCYFLFTTGQEADRKLQGTDLIMINQRSEIPAYLRFSKGKEINFNDLKLFLKKAFGMPADFDYKLLRSEPDNLGNIAYRYQESVAGIPVHDAMFIAHVRNQKIFAINGNIFNELTIINRISLSESEAIGQAIASVDANVYKWQLPSEEDRLKYITGNQQATYYPQAELVLFPVNYPGNSTNYRITYKVNIYAQTPLKKVDVYVDAQYGNIVYTMDKLITSDVLGTAVTKYSGTQPITTDSYSGSYRLRESGRGDGIETYDLNQGTGSGVDFTDADNYWNNFNAQLDEVATDAHWAAEMTYDFYWQNFNLNSIDGNGFKLISNVHYDVNYDNAFWDGQSMTYGDGSGYPYTTVDICGHEITHGLTEFTANLDYAYESGALNEGFSDIFGTAIEFFAKPSVANWTLGEDMNYIIRSLSNPNSYGLPDTYLGNYWYTGSGDNGGVHYNSGVIGYWFYLCCQGGNGVNDIGNSYLVTPVGMGIAQAVTYRALSQYLINSSQYAEARFFTILSAIDLYGGCTPEVETVTNAWYAVGLGAAYVDSVVSDFHANFTEFCAPPANVTFSNFSVNGTSFTWNFGDGATSTQINPSHSYSNYGTYNVTLSVNGGTCGTASYTANSYISVDPANDCLAIMGISGTLTQSGCSGIAYDSGGEANYQDDITSTLIIAPTSATSITLQFISFAYEEDYDYLYIYDGNGTNSPLIGQFTGYSLPMGGIITSTGGAITLRHTSDQYLNYSGFEAIWACCGPSLPPTANFFADETQTCTGIVQFHDQSFCNAASWFWDFGDGLTSQDQNPLHYYSYDGLYTVKLIASNINGNDSVIKEEYITVDLLNNPTVTSAQNCGPGSVTLSATGAYNLQWYDSPTGGNLVGTGTSFITPVLNQTTSYYVVDQFTSTPQYTGAPQKTANGSYFNNSSSWGILFDCYSQLILKKVKVYADGAATRTIQLRDSTGNILQSANVEIPDGESIIILNFNIPVENNLLLAGPPYPSLWRDNQGAAYPFEIPGIIKIKSSNVQPPSDPLNYYYYFYNWEVQQPECSSGRVECTAWILDAPVANFGFTVNSGTVDFNDMSDYPMNYLWDFGDGNTSIEANPVHTYTSVGVYTVSLIISNICGADTASQQVNITVVSIYENSFTKNINIYPNPANDVLNIEWTPVIMQNMEIALFDITGRMIVKESVIVSAGCQKHYIDLSGFTSGLYFVRISNDEMSLIRKFIKE
jgi:Zn-dependent metalloprotease